MEQVRGNDFRAGQNSSTLGRLSWVGLELSPEGKTELRERQTEEARTFQEKGMASDVAEAVTHVVYLSWPNKTCLITQHPKITLEI